MAERRMPDLELNQQRQAFLLELSDGLRSLTDAGDITAMAITRLGQHLHASRALYLDACSESGGDVDVVEGDLDCDRTAPSPIGQAARAALKSLVLSKLAGGRAVAIADIERAPAVTESERAACRAMDVRGIAAVPLMKHGHYDGGLAVLSTEPREWTAADVELLQQVAHRTRVEVDRVCGEAALRDSEQKYRMLFESIDEGFCIVEMVVDEQGKAFDYRFLETNPAFVEQTGLHDAVGRTILELAPAHERFWIETYDEIARTGMARRFEHRADALRRWYDVYAFRIGSPRDRRVAVLFNDIAGRKSTEAALRDSEERLRLLNEQLEQRVRDRTAQINGLFTRLVRAQEDERSRIARDIHDQLGQQVTAVRMSLEVLAGRLAHNDVLATHAARTQRLAEELDRSMDFLMWDLRPAALDHLGLTAALAKLVGEWSDRFEIVAEFDGPDVASVRLSRDAEINIYRLAQEALHNVLKHADATHVSVVMQRRDDDLLLVIEDNGRGFSVGETRNRAGGGLGLVTMSERAALIGAAFEIESEPGRGTTIFVRVPLARAS